MKATASELLVGHGGVVGSGTAQTWGAVADWVTTSVAMWYGFGFDVSGTKKQKGGGSRRWAFGEKRQR